MAFEQPGCTNLHERPLLLDRLAILGLQGAPSDEADAIGATLYTKPQARAHLDRQAGIAGSRSLLLVSHAPPRGVLDTSIRFGRKNVGSSVVRSFANRPRARGIVCGHVHLQGGRTELVSGCLVVNIASHDHLSAPLRYALLDWNGRRLRVIEIGTETDRGGLSGLVGAGSGRAEKLAAGGFRSLADIIDADDSALTQMFSRPEIARRWRARARAAHTRSPVVLDPTFSIGTDTLIVDVETSLLQDDPWLVAYKLAGDRKVHQIYEVNYRRHRAHIRRVATAMSRMTGARFLQWGPLDRVAIERAHRNVGIAPGPWLDRQRWTNAGAWVERAVALPVDNYKLKTIGRYFRYRFSFPDLDGMVLGTWYESYRNRGTPFDLRKALAYSRDDVLVVEHVLRNVARLVRAKDAFVEPPITARRIRIRRSRARAWTTESVARAVARYSASLQARVTRGQLTVESHARAIANFRAALLCRVKDRVR